MYVELLESEERRVRSGVGDNGLLPHYTCERGVEVEAFTETFDHVVFGEVPAVAGEEAVVCKGVEHRAGATDWGY